MQGFAPREEIRDFLEHAKDLVQSRRRLLLQRRRTMDTLARLGMTHGGLWNEILNLTVSDYVSGPEMDHHRRFPGPIWIFGLRIRRDDLYIKMKLDRYDPEGLLVCLSFHVADWPLTYPYKP